MLFFRFLHQDTPPASAELHANLVCVEPEFLSRLMYHEEYYDDLILFPSRVGEISRE